MRRSSTGARWRWWGPATPGTRTAPPSGRPGREIETIRIEAAPRRLGDHPGPAPEVPRQSGGEGHDRLWGDHAPSTPSRTESRTPDRRRRWPAARPPAPRRAPCPASRCGREGSAPASRPAPPVAEARRSGHARRGRAPTLGLQAVLGRTAADDEEPHRRHARDRRRGGVDYHAGFSGASRPSDATTIASDGH